MQQILEVAGFVIIGVWVIALLATQLWCLVEMFRTNVGLTILSFFLPFVGLYVLVRYWNDLKRPFLYQLSVVLVGIVGVMAFAVLLNGTLGESLAADVPPDEESLQQDVYQPEPPQPEPPQRELAVSPTSRIQPIPAEAPVAASWGVEVPVGENARVTVPQGWSAMAWSLPDLGVAMGNTERGEFVTLHVVEEAPGLSFDGFQRFALEEIRANLIDGGEASAPHILTIDGREVSSCGLAGRNRLPDRVGQPMSARLSCVDGNLHRYYIVQWRTSAWDTQSRTDFDRLLRSFEEINVSTAGS